MSYDPINDEKKEFSFEEWQKELADAVAEYKKAFVDEPYADFFKKPHTWREWMNSFIEFMSW